MAEAAQLQACQRCRARKVKCSKEAPQCQTCRKAQAECVFLDNPTGETYSRQDIADLETREAELRAALDSPSDGQGTRPRPVSQTAVSIHASNGTPGRQDLETIFSSPQFQPDLLKRLLAREHIHQPDVEAAAMPDADLAEFLVMTYLNESHVQKPFLLTEYIGNLVQRVYSSNSPLASDPQDLFRLFMICAISAVPLRRRGLDQQHPYSFFLAASTYLDKLDLSTGIDALQNLLLLARFAVYFHIGTSTWELGRMCIGICIELEMHLRPLFPIPALEEQHRRRLFWESYILDRHSATVLGRPFAILDEDIEVSLPVNISDQDTSGLEVGGLDRVPQHLQDPTSPMAVFVYFVRLRRITSRVQREFFTSHDLKSTASGAAPLQQTAELAGVYERLQNLLDDLEDWRAAAPVFTNMTAFYQAQSWYDFLWEKERLLLLRGAMNDISARSGSMPRDLSRSCCDCAAKVIRLYSDMFWPKQINATRHYFQTLLTAGLLVAYLSSRQKTAAVHGPGVQSEETKATLLTCSQLLQTLSEEMTDAKPYATVFELICEMTCSDWKAYKQAAVSSLFDMQALQGMNMDLPDWSYSPGYLFAGVEAYVNQYATGDFATDPMFDSVSWMRGACNRKLHH